MEKGKLIVQATKKGFMGKIAFTKKDGKTAELPISVVRFTDAKDNGKDCEFERDGGKLTKIVVDDKILYPKETTTNTHKPISHNLAKENRVADSFKLSETFLPKDVKAISTLTEIDNFALKLQKAARSDNFEGHSKFQFFLRQRKGDNYEIKTQFDSKLIEYAFNKQRKSIPKETHIHTHKAMIDWRMIVGLGSESVYETSMTLHHIYGIPYIPASSIKGMVRSWIITEVFGKDEQGREDLKHAEKRALKEQSFCDIFGCDSESYYKEAREGKVIFFDAFPTSEPKIEIDIMNPHYPKWYDGSEAPTDTQNPVPIPFLTVAGCAFQFIIGSNDNELLIKTIGSKDIKQWLKDALENHGIGAKTAVGYGYMA